MAQKTRSFRVNLTRPAYTALQEWAELEGRTMRRHGQIVLEDLVELVQSQPEELRRLRLMQPARPSHS